ncbi:hypothetical protein PHLCEN_2v11256 [Hermanssonia centrifuga]|uniref:Ankyrin repeat protein n=1 Tax=Hermanssonia centrifuga TaxID=98765 RepID=A0A2R6NKI5_9APHY|nr:hypothetical protein PHLCEN_2v11256 [Hermanssonia centrifuga]
MPQNAEATAFLVRISELPSGPGVSLDAALQPSLDDEATLRKLFAQDKTNSRLSDPSVGLVDIFDAPAAIRTTRARIIANEEDLSKRYVMPLSETARRKEGSPSMVESLEEFKKNWAIFTEGSLSQLADWNNVIASGGAVQACLTPVPDSAKVSKRALRKYFHSQAFPTSDVDLFLYGLTPAQAEVKINAIYEAVRDSIPWDVTCIRTKHTVSIHSQYPYRAVQIVLRLYRSPAEILAGFDVDVPCCAFDGSRVWANPRAIVAMMRQCNTIDITRRSPSYEVRLSKYSSRGFEICVPELKREDIDPTIFERSIVRIQGLARLLVLEKLATALSRDNYLDSRRALRGRPTRPYDWRRYATKKYKGDLKANADAGLELSDYDVISLHIPYGPGWDARRIEKLVYQTDLGMNSPYNPKNKDRRLHRHPAFFGTMEECLADCCEHCTQPKDDEERTLQEQEDQSYIRGRVGFMVEDPGRQSISGSFNPIDDGEWAEQAYMGLTEKFFFAIASHDKAAVARIVEQGADVDRRDHVGRTPLQVAILSKAEDIACYLIDAGARMTSRLVDGRTALHLAAQLDLPAVAKKLLERSAVNAETAKAAEEEAKRQKEIETEDDMETDDGASDGSDSTMRDSSDDDWSSETDDKKNPEDKSGDDDGNIPEDEEDVPDVFELDVKDWDYAFTPLQYAIVSGSVSVVEFLLASGADPKLVTQAARNYIVRYSHPLILTAATNDEDKACQIVEKLLAAGAVCSEADNQLFSIFHRMVCSGKPGLVSTFLKSDPSCKAVLSVPWMDQWSTVVFPIVSAIRSGSYSVLALLLAYGTNVVISQEDFQRARDLKIEMNQGAPQDFLPCVSMPVAAAIGQYDEVVHLLVALGAEINLPTPDTSRLTSIKDGRMTYLDYVRIVQKKASENIRSAARGSAPTSMPLPFLNSPRSSHPPLAPFAMLNPPTVAAVGRGGILSAGVAPSLGSGGMLKLGLAAPVAVPKWKSELLRIISECNDMQRKNFRPFSYNNSVYADEIKTYFQEVETLFSSNAGKSAAELTPADDISMLQVDNMWLSRIHNSPMSYQTPFNPVIKTPYSFHRLGRQEGHIGMHSNLTALYEELYEACWVGDHAKIQQLCLPQTSSKIPDTPLQISVHWGDNWQGYTPLFIAISARRWDTARLILAIASAQYDPEETKAQKFETRNINLDNESDDDDDDMDDDMEPEEEPIMNFVDIAKRPSAIHTKIRPSYMLDQARGPCPVKNGVSYHTPINKAIVEDDFEAFTQILGLYDHLQDTKTNGANFLTSDVFHQLMLHDRPPMLNEFIRRTGLGIVLKSETGVDQEAVPDNDSQQAYLGLNVHGKKRKDLAAKNDPSAPNTYVTSEYIPMLWTAAQRGLIGVIKYLASDQPLAAYRFYASSHSDEWAKRLQRMPDLEAVLPGKLGWAVSSLNESVLTAAIIGNRMDSLETLFSLRPTEMENALHIRHRTWGFNNIMAVARWGGEPAIFDFLLGKRVSPMEIDEQGRNIYHMLCNLSGEKSTKLLKHVLHQLPKETTEFMLRQQTKNGRNTPLHIAIEERRVAVVRLLLDAGANSYLQRDCDGAIPLQIAVSHCLPEITRLLAAAGPAEALVLEDGVGNTPLETASREAFLGNLNAITASILTPQGLQPQWQIKPFDVSNQEKDLVRYKATLETLLSEGRLINGTKLCKELLAFADRLERKIISEKNAMEENKKGEEDAEQNEPKDVADSRATFQILMEAIASRPCVRHLVHLSDVHESVTKGLEQHAESKEHRTDKEDEEEPAQEPVTHTLASDYNQGMPLY